MSTHTSNGKGSGTANGDVADRSLQHDIDDHPGLRKLLLEVRCWGLAHGRPVDRDALATVVLVKAERPGPFGRWTTDDVDDLVDDLPGWCEQRGRPVPPSSHDALGRLLEFLDRHGALATESHPVASLLATLRVAAGDHRLGRAHHPAARRPTTGPQGRDETLAEVIPLVS